MKAKILNKYGYYADARAMREYLGVRELPIDGMPPREIQGVTVYVKPQGPKPSPINGRGRKRMAHRIMIVCTCGVHVPSGRMRQHKCKEMA